MNAVDFHTAIAAQFDGKYQSSAAFVERFRIWTDLFDRYVKSTDEVMDLGCGSGVFSRYLARMGCTVTAIDGSAAMIDLCRQKTTPLNVCYLLETLPAGDLMTHCPQDVIVASSLLEYVTDTALMLQQANALLKPDGLLLVSVPNRLSPYRWAERVAFTLTGWPRYVAYSRYTTTETAFNRQLNSLGFQALETIYYSGHDPVSRLLKRILPARYVNNLFVGVYRKQRAYFQPIQSPVPTGTAHE